MKRLILLGAAALALSGGAASAATGDYHGAYQFQFSGVASGYDRYGIFGSNDATFQNTPFTETVSVNFAVANKSSASNYVDWTSQVSSFMVSSITIAGHTYVFGNGGAQAAALDNGNAAHALNGDNTYIQLSDSQAATFGGVSGTITTSQEIFSPPSDFGQRFSTSGGLGALTFTPSSDCAPLEQLKLKDTVASAPEPGAWALMMLGVAIVGYALSRSRARGERQHLASA